MMTWEDRRDEILKEHNAVLDGDKIMLHGEDGREYIFPIETGSHEEFEDSAWWIEAKYNEKYYDEAPDLYMDVHRLTDKLSGITKYLKSVEKKEKFGMPVR